MIIDFHTHTFPDNLAASAVEKLSQISHTPPFSDGTTSGLLQSMQTAALDCSVLLPVATSPRQVLRINDSAAAINERFPKTGIFSLGGIHPDYEDWKNELTRIASLGLKGIKLHPVYQHIDFDDLRILRILDKAAELNLFVVTHGGIDIGYPELEYCSPAQILRAVQQVPGVTLIAAHMGGWKNWEEVCELLCSTSVYLDTAFSTDCFLPLEDGFHSPEYTKLLNEEQFLHMVELFGADRILFGTDSPWSDQKTSLEWIQALPLAPEQKTAILGENAQKLLGLEM